MSLNETTALTAFIWLFFSCAAYSEEFACTIGQDSYERRNSSFVTCGCRFESYARSSDGSQVCAGGLFDGYARSSDGSKVVCGGIYDGYARSSDGSKECAGGWIRLVRR